MSRVREWAAFVAFLLLASLLLFPADALAESEQPQGEVQMIWVVGDALQAAVVYCKAKEDAKQIAQAYSEGGYVAADEVLVSKIGPQVVEGFCTYRPARFIVRALASSHRGAGGAINVIEVEDVAGGGTFYVVHESRVAPRGRRA